MVLAVVGGFLLGPTDYLKFKDRLIEARFCRRWPHAVWRVWRIKHTGHNPAHHNPVFRDRTEPIPRSKSPLLLDRTESPKDIILLGEIPQNLTRNISKLQRPLVLTSIASRSFTVAAPTVWNSLSVNTRSADSFASFKRMT